MSLSRYRSAAKLLGLWSRVTRLTARAVTGSRAIGLVLLLRVLFQHFDDEVVVRVDANVGGDLHGLAPDLLGVEVRLVDQRTRSSYEVNMKQKMSFTIIAIMGDTWVLLFVPSA